MKPFDLQAALAGAKVVTRDGREVNIVETKHGQIIGWAGNLAWWWFVSGQSGMKGGDGFDLFMAPTEKKEWILRIDYGRGPLIEGPFNDIEYCKERAAYHYNRQGLNTIHEITVIE